MYVYFYNIFNYIERINSVNLQYEHFFNVTEDFMRTLDDFTCMVLYATVQDVEARVQDIETKNNPVNLMTHFY